MGERRSNTIQFDDDRLQDDIFGTMGLEDLDEYFFDAQEDWNDTLEEVEDTQSDSDEETQIEVQDELQEDENIDEVNIEGNSGVKEQTEYYEIVSVDNSFISSTGDIVVMDTSIPGDNFKFMYIDIENIAVAKRIRATKNVEDLVKSIKSTGLLMPVVVAPTATEGVYVLLSGFRRLIACAKAGIRRIPCVVNMKVSTPEIPILEAMYNHCKPYTMKEIVEYINYLEKEKGILSASMIEYLLQLDNGDYTKLKDILNDDDPDIVSKLMNGQMTIGQAFKKLEQRRKNESREEKELKKAQKVYEDDEESGVEHIEGAGQVSEGEGLSDEELKSLAILANDLDDDRTLEDVIEEGKGIEGYEPKQQDYRNREMLDPALRKAVLARDNNTCKCCGLSGPEYISSMDAHHIVEVYLGGKDEIDNLICLCVICHRLVHEHARGDLYMRPIHEMDEHERSKFKRIIALGNIIRKGLVMKGLKREDLKKLDKAETIGRTKPGTGQVAG